MDVVRESAAGLVAEGAIEVTQGGEPVDLATARGPIRLRKRTAEAEHGWSSMNARLPG